MLPFPVLDRSFPSPYSNYTISDHIENMLTGGDTVRLELTSLQLYRNRESLEKEYFHREWVTTPDYSTAQ